MKKFIYGFFLGVMTIAFASCSPNFKEKTLQNTLWQSDKVHEVYDMALKLQGVEITIAKQDTMIDVSRGTNVMNVRFADDNKMYVDNEVIGSYAYDEGKKQIIIKSDDIAKLIGVPEEFIEMLQLEDFHLDVLTLTNSNLEIEYVLDYQEAIPLTPEMKAGIVELYPAAALILANIDSLPIKLVGSFTFFFSAAK